MIEIEVTTTQAEHLARLIAEHKKSGERLTYAFSLLTAGRVPAGAQLVSVSEDRLTVTVPDGE